MAAAMPLAGVFWVIIIKKYLADSIQALRWCLQTARQNHPAKHFKQMTI